jgi:hypothetical protein
MKIANRSSASPMPVRGLCVMTALAIIGFTALQARAEQPSSGQTMTEQAKVEQVAADQFKGPSFRKGLWHFVRTLDLVAHRKSKQRLLERELTACG